MQFNMTPEEFFRLTIDLYADARKSKFAHPHIHRGRSRSISSELEDLLALYLAKNNPTPCEYYTDQQVRFGGRTRYPDIIVQQSDGTINDLIDVKSDIGWKRDSLFEFCSEWEATINEMKGKTVSFLRGADKQRINGKFSDKLKYHVVLISRLNSSKVLEEHYNRVRSELDNVDVYLLSGGRHPNDYGIDREELLSRMEIDHAEFGRLMTSITST